MLFKYLYSNFTFNITPFYVFILDNILRTILYILQIIHIIFVLKL